jgi:hypothetical protein
MEADVKAQIEALGSYWNANDIQGIIDLWDTDDPYPVYQAEEEEALAASWPALRDYWSRTRALSEKMAVRYSAIGVKLFSSHDALAHWALHWDMKLAGRPKPMGGDNRAFALLRLKPEGWRFHAYIEGPLAPITYMRKLYEAQVSASF